MPDETIPENTGDPMPSEPHIGRRFARFTAPRELYDANQREKWKLPRDEERERGPYIIELNVLHVSGLPGADTEFKKLCHDLGGNEPPVRIGKSYYRCLLSVQEWKTMIARDEKQAEQRAGTEEGDLASYRAIYKLWPDFPLEPHTDRSMATVKADAALRSFDANGEGVTWAVIDSGIDAQHPHFGSGAEHLLLAPGVADLHRCFIPVFQTRNGIRVKKQLSTPDETEGLTPEARQERVHQHREWALNDEYGHGTHVAGIIAGQAPNEEHLTVRALTRQDKVDENGGRVQECFCDRARVKPTRLRGVAPHCKLISLRVLDENGEGRSSDVIQALDYIREKLNDNPKLLRVQGVNLSVGYEFDAEMFACGQSPLCTEVNRLVQAGVVVVTAAGNTGYGRVAASARTTQVGLSNTINDPGNADLAITVGATHREFPHTYGVSYFSSKGPTGDGRLKPDLVAPGERITSCGAGRKLDEAKKSLKEAENGKTAYYIDDSGTSMAAPHVSGAIAAFLSIRREFIGKPLEVKRIFLDSATPLGRERYFEGHGLVDLMRAIQSV